MREQRDVIVIGSGIGGLTAAAHLVAAGRRVLVLERNPHIGGTAYVYHRKGFTFPMGPLGFGHPGLVRRTLKDLGVGKDLAFRRVHYRVRAFDLDLPLSLPFPELVGELAQSFPSDAGAVARFFATMAECLPSPEADLRRSGAHANYSISAAAYLHHHIRDGRLRRILGSIGTQEPYSGLPLLAAMWNLMSHEGIWFPEEGMQLFCERLVKAVADSGDGRGEVRLNNDVAAIRTDRGEVSGVVLRDGTQVDASAVVSNADYKTTFLRFLDRGTIPPPWYEAVSHARQTGSVFQVCLGVDARQVDLSAFAAADRIVYRSPRSDGQEDEGLDGSANEIDPKAIARRELEVSLWERDRERVAAEGRAHIVIRAEAEYGHFAAFHAGWRRRTPRYGEYKTRLAQAVIREVEHLVPGLAQAILVMDVATPLTFADQGGRSGGAVAGWSWDYEDFRDGRPKELVRTPIKGLYMAGYQAFSALFLGGVPTAMESGKRAAAAVLERAAPIDEIAIPGARNKSLAVTSEIPE